MNREDIIRMAREAGYFLYDLTETHGIKTVETDEIDQWVQLERFAALVAAHEREACALVLDKVIEHLYIYNYDGDASTELRRCAKAIRARGEV